MKNALVTGAGRNLGRGFALELARQGHRVLLAGRTGEPLESVREEILAARGSAEVVLLDVADQSGTERALAVSLASYGPVSILINNAVIRSQRPLLEMPVDEWRQVLDVTLTGAFLCTRALLPGMIEQGWGRIVNMAGISGQTGVANRVGVSAAKAGVIGMTRAVAAEFATSGITANAISPGGIDTEKGSWTSQGDRAAVLAHYEERARLIPMKRRGTVDEVAALCGYLCSDSAAFITGQVFNINGGTHMP